MYIIKVIYICIIHLTMTIMVTILAAVIVTLGAIITIKGKPIEFTTPKWMEWVQRLADGK